MNTTKILESEIKDIKISSLPTRPTAPTSFGGKGFTAAEMKSAFDKLPLLIIERFNSLLDDLESADENSIISSIKTCIFEEHTLRDLFNNILDGTFAEYLSLGELSLMEFKTTVEQSLETMREDVNTCLPIATENSIDGGTPALRKRGDFYK